MPRTNNNQNNNRAAAPNWSRVGSEIPADTWESTGKTIWNLVMGPHGQAFDQIGLADLTGENSLALMTNFVERVVASPPHSAHKKALCNVVNNEVS